jgi:hypothetical protein
MRGHLWPVLSKVLLAERHMLAVQGCIKTMLSLLAMDLMSFDCIVPPHIMPLGEHT